MPEMLKMVPGAHAGDVSERFFGSAAIAGDARGALSDVRGGVFEASGAVFGLAAADFAAGPLKSDGRWLSGCSMPRCRPGRMSKTRHDDRRPAEAHPLPLPLHRPPQCRSDPQAGRAVSAGRATPEGHPSPGTWRKRVELGRGWHQGIR